jgi:glyceraldehyde 3-phosphate dehydrogenase
MAARVGINGLGRIGRSFWRAARRRGEVEVVGVNDLTSAATLAHLLRYDSVRGRLDAPVAVDGDAIVLDGRRVPVRCEADPAAIGWRDWDVDVVLESTGRFFWSADVGRHLTAGAPRVVISMAAPDPDVTVVMGINEPAYDPAEHRIVSPGCCTSNAVGPILSVLQRQLEIEAVQLTTIHAYDSTHSSLTDSPKRNLRMGRAAAVNMIPSRIKDTTRALGSVLPELAGRMEGLAVRVPAGIGCAADIVATVARPAPAAEVNRLLATAATAELKDILGYTDDAIVSADVAGSPLSCTVDGLLTTVVGDTVKVFVWYDNEWGFANRLVDVVALAGAAG